MDYTKEKQRHFTDSISLSNDITTLLQGQPLDIVCLSDTLWDTELWTNRQYAVSTLANMYENVRVLYIEPPSFVYQKGTGIAKSWPSGAPVIRNDSPMPFCRQVQERIWVLHPPLPVPLRTVRKIAFSALQRETLLLTRSALKRLGFKSPILWAYNPYAGWYVDRLNECFRIYDCLDEHSACSYYSWDRQRVTYLETKFMRAANTVFTVSDSLQEHKSPFNPNTFMLGNPVNYELFAKAQERNIERPKMLSNRAGPILGFYGALASYKIDIDLLGWLAKTHPDWNLVLIGPTKEPGWGKLGAYPNVTILPAISQIELISYVAWFDVLLMPYRVNKYTMASNPLKLHEYFATGKSVVSTYIPDEQLYRDLIFLANDNQSFADGIKQALQDNDSYKQQQRITIAGEKTWNHKVHRMITIMTQHGLLEKL